MYSEVKHFEKFEFGDFVYLMLRKIPPEKRDDLCDKIIEKQPCKTELISIDVIDNFLRQEDSVFILQFYKGKECGISIITIITQNNYRNKIYIERFCTSLECEEKKLKCGQNLMNFIKHYYCSKKKCSIELNSVPSATGFYEKMLFKRARSDILNNYLYVNWID